MPRPRIGPERLCYQGRVFSIHERTVTFPNGTNTVYEYCRRPESVSVLAFDRRERMMLIHELRPGYRSPTWFLPGGRVDPGDTPRKAAIRELREETGFTAHTIQLVHKKSPSASLLWNIYTFAARDLVQAPLPMDAGEDIREVRFVPLRRAVRMALDGTIDNEFISYTIIRFEYMLSHGQFRWK